MPINYFRGFTHAERSVTADRRLGRSLAFVAGAANAGGFLAVGQYTSHMSGIASSLADNLVLGNLVLFAAALGSLLSFVMGAATSAILINWGRRRHLRSRYAIPLMLEAFLLLCFGLLGSHVEAHRAMFVSATVCTLCYVMGLQNAMITKISKAEIRTTHVTGLITDIGIELGKLMYWNADRTYDNPVRADRQKLALFGSLLLSFVLGGLAGAAGFRHLGYVSAVPLALALTTFAVVPIFDDVRALRRFP